MSDFNFSKLNRNSTWKDIFDTIDDNFSKVAEYLATAGNKVRIDRFTAKAGQTDFTLSDDYNTTQNSLIVYVNGSRQFLTTGFTETSTNTFKLVTACSAGDQVVAVYNKYYIFNDKQPELPIATGAQLGVVIPDTDTISVDSSGRIKVNEEFANQIAENAVTKVSTRLTKDSVGLNNVDNTSDADKHVLANNIQWGGNSIESDVSPIDAAMSNAFSGNVMDFANPAGITIEYSTDGGASWNDYGASDQFKIALVTCGTLEDIKCFLGKNNKAQTAGKDLLRITLNGPSMNVYCQPKNLLIYYDMAGAIDNYVTIDYSYGDTPDTFFNYGKYPISGWSGWNSIPINMLGTFGANGRNHRPANLRLTFSFTAYLDGWSSRTTSGVMKILMTAVSRWITNSNSANNNHLYTYDASQNAFFPAQVTATKFNGTATNAEKANGHTVNKDVPSDAKFTDTTYPVATTSADGLMSKSDKAKLDGVADQASQLYPVGSIYISVNATNPAELFGGTWERIKDRFLLAAGNIYAAGSTGGWDTHIHKYGFQYGAFFGSISMEKDDQSGALQGGTGNPVGSTIAGQAHSLVNNNVAQDTKNIDTTHYKSIADTSSASNMPPYLAVYMWKRTA